jgi:GNAT superfamily N-acetyltransferase
MLGGMPETPESLIAESHRQVQEAWRYFAVQLPGGDATEEPGLLLTNGRSPLPFMNAAFFTSPATTEADVRSRLARAAAHFREGGHPFVFMPGEDMLAAGPADGLTDLCAELGLGYMMPMTGMVADELSPPVRPLPDLAFRTVTDAEMRDAVGDINAAGYDIPAEAMRAATSVASLWDGMIGVVGLVDGVPASTASVIPVDGVAYVALVATLPSHQGKGYAEAVMRRVLDEARERWGTVRTVLHATPAGNPVYTRMGYRPTSTFHVYVGH